MKKMITSVMAAGAMLAASGGAVLASAPAMASTGPHIDHIAPSFKDKLDLHAGQPGGPLSAHPRPFNPAVAGDGVTVKGKICLDGNGNPTVGGDCYWESAVQLWYNMKTGTNESGELATVYQEYGHDFQDGWTDDDAWWGITWQLGNQLYGTSSWLTTANNLWTYDTGTGWDSNCGGSTLQHPGGAQNDISRASLGELAHALGKSSSSQNAASWIFSHMQGSGESTPASEGLNTQSSDPCSVSSQISEEGGQAESWKTENVNGDPGQTGTHNSATAQHPDNDFHNIFDELYSVYGL